MDKRQEKGVQEQETSKIFELRATICNTIQMTAFLGIKITVS